MEKARWWAVMVDGKQVSILTSYSEQVALREAKKGWGPDATVQPHPWDSPSGESDAVYD